MELMINSRIEKKIKELIFTIMRENSIDVRSVKDNIIDLSAKHEQLFNYVYNLEKRVIFLQKEQEELKEEASEKKKELKEKINKLVLKSRGKF